MDENENKARDSTVAFPKVSGIVESLAVLFYIAVFLFVGPASLIIIFYLPFATGHWLSILVSTTYMSYWCWDLSIASRGGRNKAYIGWMRGWGVWRHFINYFPVNLVKTADIDPNKNYLFCAHPHGILAFGVWGSMATEGADFSKRFPGIKPKLLTLEGNFWMPGFRELVLGSGACASSKKSMQFLLNSEPGTSPILVVGGLPEISNFHEDKIVLVIKKRKGFLKLALQNGSDLVPVFTFGETEIFHQNVSINSFLKPIGRFLGFEPVCFAGRGFLQRSFGILPERRELNVVVGRPINVDKVADPSVTDINQLQEKYIAAVNNLFEENKEKYGETKKLVIT